MKEHYIIPIFVSQLISESNSILYMNDNSEQKISITKEKVREIIENYLKNVENEEAKVEIVFCGGSFTSIDEEKQEELLNIAYEYIKDRKVDSIRILASADEINKERLKKFKRYKVKTIELETPSTNDYILKRIGEKYNLEDIKKASKMIKWNGLKLGYQMMVGLPESTRIDEVNTAKELIKLKPKMVRIYPTLVIKNTKLEKEFEEGQYKPLSIVQAVEICKDLVRMFADKDIDILNVGIDVDDEAELNKTSKIVSGPSHPAFRQLVESAMWYDAIVEKIKKLNVKVKEVEVTVNPKDSDNVIGHKQENVQKLKELYDVDLVLNQDEKIKQGKSKIEITKTYED